MAYGLPKWNPVPSPMNGPQTGPVGRRHFLLQGGAGLGVLALSYLVSARKPLYRSFPVTIHHTFRASCSPISSRKMPAIGLGGVIGGGPAPIFGTRP